MRRLGLLALVLSFLFTQTLDAQDQVFLRGRAWVTFPDEVKLAYVAGLADLALWLYTWKAMTKESGDLYLAETPRDEIVKGIDRIYSDPANANVPVVAAYRAFVMRLQGKPDADVDKIIRAMRTF